MGRAVCLGYVGLGQRRQKDAQPEYRMMYVLVPLNPGIPGHPPLPDQGSTRLPYSFKQVVGATAAAAVVLAGKVMIG